MYGLPAASLTPPPSFGLRSAFAQPVIRTTMWLVVPQLASYVNAIVRRSGTGSVSPSGRQLPPVGIQGARHAVPDRLGKPRFVQEQLRTAMRVLTFLQTLAPEEGGSGNAKTASATNVSSSGFQRKGSERYGVRTVVQRLVFPKTKMFQVRMLCGMRLETWPDGSDYFSSRATRKSQRLQHVKQALQMLPVRAPSPRIWTQLTGFLGQLLR